MTVPKVSFIRDVSKLSSAAAVTYTLSFFLSPIISRLFPPSAFGEFALFTSFAAILTSVTGFRYQLAVVLPESRAEAKSLMAGTASLILICSFGCVLLLLLLREPVSSYLNWPSARYCLPFVAVSILLNAFLNLFDNWLVRSKKYGIKGIQQVVTSAITSLGSLLFGVLGLKSFGFLVISGMLGTSSGIAVQLFGVDKWWRISWKEYQPSSIADQLRKYRKFALVDTCAGLLNVISVNLAPFLLAYFFSQEVVGQYSRSLSLVQIPMTLFGAAIGQVFYQRAAIEKAAGTLDEFVGKTLVTLISLGLFAFFLLGIAGRDIFIILLGKNWEMAGVFSQIVSPWCFFVFLGSPISTLLFVLDKQEINLAFNVITVFVRGISLIIGGIKGNVMLGVILFSLTGSSLYFILIMYFLYIVRLPISRVLSECRQPLIFFSILSIVFLIAKTFVTSMPIFIMGLSFFLGCSYYAMLLIKCPSLFRSSY